MKRIILSLLFATAAFGQISVQKKQDGSNQISNGAVVVGSNNSITATGTGIIAATAIPSISIITTAPLTGGAALTGNLTLAIPQSSGSVNGYLSSGDWTIFNTKQPAGSYITALTGDGSAAGPGSAVFTLATVLGSPGSVGTATNAPVITFDAKGRATATSTITITPALGSITGLGTGVATFLATPSSANLATAITDETGTGALVFGTSPTLVSPHFGSIANTGTLTLPTVTDTLIGRATTDVMTNKSISGSTNTLTNIPNSALTNQGITLGTTVVNLGGTITSLAGINSITAASATDLVLSGGSAGASLTLGQGTNGALTFTAAGTGGYLFNGAPTDMLGTGRSNNLSVYNTGAGTIQLGTNATAADTAQGTLFFGTTGASSGKQGAAIQARNSGTITTQAASYLQFFINTGSGLAEAARITSGLNLLIGTTTDISGSGGLSVAGTTASTSTTTGALQVVGGVGIGGALWVGGLANIAGNLTVSGAGPSNFDVSSAGTGAAEILSLKSNVASNSARKSLTWRDGSNIIGQIDVSYNGATTSLALGHLYNAGYQTSDVLVLNGNGNATLAGSLSLAANATIQPSSTGYLVVSSNGNNLYLDAPPVGGHVYQRVNGGTIISDVSSAGLALAGNLAVSGTGTSSFAGPITTIQTGGAFTGDVLLVSQSGTGGSAAYNMMRFRDVSNGADRFRVDGAGNVFMGADCDLQIGRAYASGATTATGTLDMKDKTGTTYHVLVHN